MRGHLSSEPFDMNSKWKRAKSHASCIVDFASALAIVQVLVTMKTTDSIVASSLTPDPSWMGGNTDQHLCTRRDSFERLLVAAIFHLIVGNQVQSKRKFRYQASASESNRFSISSTVCQCGCISRSRMCVLGPGTHGKPLSSCYNNIARPSRSLSQSQAQS